jgi:hypothetical protein
MILVPPVLICGVGVRIHMACRLALLVLAFVLAGEGSTLAQSVPVRVTRMPPTYMETAPENVVRALEARTNVPASDALALIANRTRLIAPLGAPIQVAYADAAGTIILWFPGSGELRRGRWHIEERVWELFEGGRTIKTVRQATICYNYGGMIPNIFAPEHMRNTLCPSVAHVRGYMLDSKPGDMFGLARGSPGALGRVQARKLEELSQRLRS